MTTEEHEMSIETEDRIHDFAEELLKGINNYIAKQEQTRTKPGQEITTEPQANATEKNSR